MSVSSTPSTDARPRGGGALDPRGAAIRDRAARVTEGPDVTAEGTVPQVPRVSCPEVSDGSGIDGGAEYDARQREMATRMDQMIAALPDREREVLVLRLVRRLSVEDTAETLGSTPTGVLVAQHQALDLLRGSIARAGGGCRA